MVFLLSTREAFYMSNLYLERLRTRFIMKKVVRKPVVLVGVRTQGTLDYKAKSQVYATEKPKDI